MPERNPDIWGQIWAYFVSLWVNHNHYLCSMVIAFLVAFTRPFLLNGRRETKTGTLADAIVCSAIVWAVLPLLRALQIDADYLPMISIVIGMFGVKKIRDIGIVVARNRWKHLLDDKEHKPK